MFGPSGSEGVGSPPVSPVPIAVLPARDPPVSDDNSSGDKKSGGLIAKIVATVFATVLAPISVGLGIKYFGPSDKPSPTTEQSKDKDDKNAAAPKQEPFHFNGTDLSGFDRYLAERGRDQDPRGVFTVKDGVLRISGEEAGYLATQKVYHHYTLHTEYRWGEKTWGNRETKARISAIAVHAESEGLLELARKGSYLCFIREGMTGDLVLQAGDVPPPCRLIAEIDPNKAKPPAFQFSPRGAKTTLGPASYLWGLNHDPAAKDVKGFRGKNEGEKPTGEWNTLEIVCGPNNILVILNGRTVNAGSQLTRNKGKLLFGSGLAEIFFRKIDVIPAEK
jgi:hypothetical protein